MNLGFYGRGNSVRLEDAPMKSWMNGTGRSLLVAASILFFGLLLAGCDDHIIVTRDPNIRAGTRGSFAAPLDAGNRGAGDHPKSAMKMFASVKALWFLTS